jgi:hypothetical protein
VICQAYGSGAWNQGICGPFVGPRRYVSERFGVSGERGPRGRVGSGAEPDGDGDRRGIRPVGIEGPGRCSGRCSGGQAEMGKDLGNHGGMLDGGDDLQGATATQGQCSLSISNTRLSSRAQLMGAGAAGGGVSAWSAEGVLALTGTENGFSGPLQTAAR